MITKLHGVHPRLVAAFQRISYAMAELGHPIVVTDGLRTLAQQQALYAQGRTAPGKKVTNADGVRAKSNHQAKDDGLGYAIDCAFLVDGKASWAEHHPWRLYGEAAKSQGLRWGGEFTTIVDRPHIELPPLDDVRDIDVGADVKGGGAV
jgi:peptidoglycan L-alanyl-D-glutamate endopeptidase CwlK